MSAYFDGLLYGLIFIFSFGPSFFALLQAALKHGFTRAFFISLGVNMTDAVIISLVLVGFSSVLENEAVRFWSGLGGAVVLILFGASSWFQSKKIQIDDDTESKPLFSFWLKGVVLNGLNPTVALFWVGVVGSVSALGYTTTQQFGFFGGFLTTVLTVDACKALLITRFSHFVTDRALTMVNRVVGTLFILFGLRLLVYLFGGV